PRVESARRPARAAPRDRLPGRNDRSRAARPREPLHRPRFRPLRRAGARGGARRALRRRARAARRTAPSARPAAPRLLRRGRVPHAARARPLPLPRDRARPHDVSRLPAADGGADAASAPGARRRAIAPPARSALGALRVSARVRLADRAHALILAAGRGSRLRPFTDETPKPLLEVAGRPLGAYGLGLLGAHGCDEVVVSVHRVGGMIVAPLGVGDGVGLRITYSVERELLDAGGGIRRAATLLPGGFPPRK